MEIKKSSPYSVRAGQKPQAVDTRPMIEKTAAPGDRAPGTDRVQFSREYMEIVNAKKIMMEGDDMRTEQVAALRDMVQSDSYAVAPEAVADSMLEIYL